MDRFAFYSKMLLLFVVVLETLRSEKSPRLNLLLILSK